MGIKGPILAAIAVAFWVLSAEAQEDTSKENPFTGEWKFPALSDPSDYTTWHIVQDGNRLSVAEIFHDEDFPPPYDSSILPVDAIQIDQDTIQVRYVSYEYDYSSLETAHLDDSGIAITVEKVLCSDSAFDNDCDFCSTTEPDWTTVAERIGEKGPYEGLSFSGLWEVDSHPLGAASGENWKIMQDGSFSFCCNTCVWHYR